MVLLLTYEIWSEIELNNYMDEYIYRVIYQGHKVCIVLTITVQLNLKSKL